jgi:hypothetical protein
VNASPLKIRSLQPTPVNVYLARPHPTGSGLVKSALLVLMDLERGQGLTGHAHVLCYNPIALRPMSELIEALRGSRARFITIGCARQSYRPRQSGCTSDGQP